MIIHPFLLPHVNRIDIGPEHQFADRRAVHVQFKIFNMHHGRLLMVRT